MQRYRQPRVPAGELLESGWLSKRAACAVLDCTPRELDRHVRDGAIRCRSIGHGFRLYQVPTGRE